MEESGGQMSGLDLSLSDHREHGLTAGVGRLSDVAVAPTREDDFDAIVGDTGQTTLVRQSAFGMDRKHAAARPVLAVGLNPIQLKAADAYLQETSDEAALIVLHDSHDAREWLSRNRHVPLVVLAQFLEADAWGLCTLLIQLPTTRLLLFADYPRECLPVILTDHANIRIVKVDGVNGMTDVPPLVAGPAARRLPSRRANGGETDSAALPGVE